MHVGSYYAAVNPNFDGGSRLTLSSSVVTLMCIISGSSWIWEPEVLALYHVLRSSKWSAHLRDIPSLGGGTMVHALDEVPTVRATVEDAGGFLLIARVEASKRTEGIVCSKRPVSVICFGMEE